MIQQSAWYLALSVALLSGCGDDSSSGSTTTGGSGGQAGAEVDAGSEAAAGADTGTGGAADSAVDEAAVDAAGSDADSGPSCGRVPGPADAERVAVVSFPYGPNSAKAEVYGVLKLTSAGALSFTGETFSMGRAFTGEMVFTPDGELGMVVQEDGSLGVFKVGDGGSVSVVHAKFKGGFYAARLVMHPSGDRVYVLDSQWVNNGGGVYSVRIGCDGMLEDEGRIVEAKLPYVLVPVPGKGRYVVAAKDLAGGAAGDDAHLVTLEPQLARLASADVFADDEQIIASGAVTTDGRYVLLGDNNEYGSVSNRIAVLEVGDGTLTPRQVLGDVLDPLSIKVSPYGDVAIVVSGYGNALKVLGYESANSAAPFSLKGDVAYQGAKPQLPAGAVMLERGQLKGRVLISENVGVRMVQFTGQGTGVNDLGLTSAGSGIEHIVGAVGVQP